MSFDAIRSRLNRSEGSSAPSHRHPVVIIDDDATIREGLAFALADQYQITACATAQEGVNAVDEDVCAVVLDVKMHGNDGFWACSEIRRIAPDIPVIFYSAYQCLKNPYEIINEHRPFGYICKSDDAQQLMTTLAMAVKLQSMAVHNRKLIRTLQKAQRSPS